MTTAPLLWDRPWGNFFNCPQGRMTKACKAQRTKCTGAMFVFLNNSRTHHLHTPYIVFQLLYLQALSVMGHGCEVWGPGAFLEATNGKITICDIAFEDAHHIFMRRTLCVGKNTCIAVMCHALNRTPVLAVWILRMLNFWNRLLLRGRDDLLAQSVHSQLDKPSSWGHQVIQLINEMPGGHTPPIDTYGRPNHIQPVTMTVIVKALVAPEHDRDWHQ
jgi:hypothetical protein